MTDTHRVMAFDLSLTNSGWAVGDVTDNKLTVVDFGSIGTKRWAKEGTGKRLHKFAEEIERIYKKYQPDSVAKERSFSNGRIKATQQIFKVNGVWEMLSHLEAHDAFKEYAATSVKKELTGDGRASKPQVRTAVESILGVTPRNEDESDALAVLYTHCIREELL